MNVFRLIKRFLNKPLYCGKKIDLTFAPHRVDTAGGGMMVVNLIVRADIHRAITVRGRSLHLWQLDDGGSRLLKSTEAEHAIKFAANDRSSDEWVAFSATGTALSSPCFLEFRCWETLSVQRRIPLPSGLVWPQSLAVAPDGRLIAAASYEEALLLYDGASGELLAKSDRQNALITGLSFSPDARLLAAAYTDQGGGDILIFDVSQSKLDLLQESLPRGDLANFDLADSVVKTAFSPNGDHIIAYETYGWRQDERQQGSLASYRMPGAVLEWTKVLASDDIPEEFVRLGSVACCFDTQPEFSADSQIVYVGTARGEVTALSITDGAELARLKIAEDGFVHQVAVDNTARKLWSVSSVMPVSTTLFSNA